jgi:hypothetical protein
MNFVGALVGGISVAFVEILSPEVLSPPNGAPAVAMLVALGGSVVLASAPAATADRTAGHDGDRRFALPSARKPAFGMVSN